MKNNKNLTFASVRLSGITWRLFFLISSVFTFLPTLLFASDSLSTHIVAPSEAQVDIEGIKNDGEQEPTIFISEGTVVVGIENISNPASDDFNAEKITAEKPIRKEHNSLNSVSKKTVENKKIVKRSYKPEEINYITSKNSEESFELHKQQYTFGTLTIVTSLKAVVTKSYFDIPVSFTDDTNSLYSYYSPFKNTKTDFSFFTRPPPYFTI